MSRVGKKPIPLPQGVSITLNGPTIEVKGPKGTLFKNIPGGIAAQVDKQTLTFSVKENAPENASALHGMIRTLIANMVHGVVQPWTKDLEIQGVGYRASKAGQVLNLAVGYSHPVDFKVPEKVEFSVDAKQTLVKMWSIDKELLGITAAEIRSIRPPEPYKGKGIRYVGEQILRKAGKAAGAVGGGATGAAGGGKK